MKLFDMTRDRYFASLVALLALSSVPQWPAAEAVQLPAACLEAAQVVGPCRAALPRWSYDAASMTCAPGAAHYVCCGAVSVNRTCGLAPC